MCDFYLAFWLNDLSRHEHLNWDWKRCATWCDPWELKWQRQTWRSGPLMHVRSMKRCWQVLGVKSSTITTGKLVESGQASSWGMLRITTRGLGHDVLRFGQGWRPSGLGLGQSRRAMCFTAEAWELIDHPHAACVYLVLDQLPVTIPNLYHLHQIKSIVYNYLPSLSLSPSLTYTHFPGPT